MSAAERQRRCRQLRARDERIYRVPMKRRMIEDLYDLGLVNDNDTDEQIGVELRLLLERAIATLKMHR